MPVSEALGQPFFLICLMAVIVLGLWASFYVAGGPGRGLRSHTKHSAPRDRRPWPVARLHLSVPLEDRVLLTRSELAAQLAVLVAGRVAEEVVFGDPTTGAEEDLARATALAHKMVRESG